MVREKEEGDTKESVSGGGGDGASSFDCGPMADWYTTTNAEMLGRVCQLYNLLEVKKLCWKDLKQSGQCRNKIDGTSWRLT